ncbi:MAG: MerR family transcriptional regulator [Bacteroidota bacterium]
MPVKTNQVIEKIYFSISEVAVMFNVNTSLIRFWEKEFDIIQPHKNKKGTRYFTKEDIDNFHLIFHLVKERGFTLQGAKDKLNENKTETVDQHEIVKSLEKIQRFLIEIKESM